MNLNEITAVTCGNVVTELEAGLCKNMVNLRSFSIENSLISEVPDECFSGCAKLE